MSKENILNIDIIRHAQKDSSGQLTESGRGSAEAYGERLKEDLRKTKVYTSDIQRAVDTGNLISEGAQTEYSVRQKSYLSEYPYTDENLSELKMDGGKWLFLEEGNEDLPSTRVVAGKLAKFILDTQKGSKHIENKDEINLIAVSHVPTIMCFMSHAIADNEGKSEIDLEVVEKLEGAMGSKFTKTLEGFNVAISDENISVNIGDLNIDLEQEFLEDLVSVHDAWVDDNKVK